MAKCLECTHWKPCFNGKEWDAAIASPCKYFSPDNNVGGRTNADRIRAMSDEELTNALMKALTIGCPPVDCGGWKISCEHCWLDWLKQFVKDGGDDGRT